MTSRPLPSRLALATAIGISVAGCGSLNVDKVWPFGKSDQPTPERNRAPANATEYLCKGNKRIYVRKLDDNAVWLIYPEREFRLARAEGGDNRYSNGSTTLTIDGASATVTDATGQPYEDCKAKAAAS